MFKRGPITTHILDVSLGKPAQGIECRLEKLADGQNWNEVGKAVTNSDGRIENFADFSLNEGTYRIEFLTKNYFVQKNTPSFYPSVTVVFEIQDRNSHYHVPLLLSPFGYSTYRGS